MTMKSERDKPKQKSKKERGESGGIPDWAWLIPLFIGLAAIAINVINIVTILTR